MIDPDDLTPDLLTQRIIGHLRRPHEVQPKDPPDLNGAAAAASLTLSVLASKNEQIPS